LELGGFGGIAGCDEDCCGGVLGDLWVGELVLYSFLLCLGGLTVWRTNSSPIPRVPPMIKMLLGEDILCWMKESEEFRTFDEVDI
jgi:hypothetical protein